MEATMPHSPKITFDNVHQFKPSELIESVLEDIDSILARGIRLDMGEFFNEEDCAVCLGGAKLLGMRSDNINLFLSNQITCRQEAITTNKAEWELEYVRTGEYVAELFDKIRWGSCIGVAHGIANLYSDRMADVTYSKISQAVDGWKGRHFVGKILGKDIVALKQSIIQLVTLLKAANI